MKTNKDARLKCQRCGDVIPFGETTIVRYAGVGVPRIDLRVGDCCFDPDTDPTDQGPI